MAVAQDNRGFMWFGTDDGLYRYDGYTLKPYRHDANQPGSLSDNTVKVIYKDRAGGLWIGTVYGGLDKLDPERDVFTHYQHKPDDSHSLSDQSVNCIYEDHEGALWVGTQLGLNRFDSARGWFVHYSSDLLAKADDDAIESIYEDHQHNLWVGTGHFLKRLDRSSGQLKPFPEGAAGKLYAPEYVGAIAEDRAGFLWLGSPMETGLNRLDPGSGQFTYYGFGSNGPPSPQLWGVNWLHGDEDGILWVGTVRDGLFQFEPKSKSVTRRSNDTVTTFFQDAERNIWLGTHLGVGSFRAAHSFVNYLDKPGLGRIAPENAALSVFEDSAGFLWIGTGEGLARLDRRTGQSTRYRHNAHDPTSLSNDAVEAIVKEGSNRLWIGTHGGGVDLFDPASGRFQAYSRDLRGSNSLSSDFVQCLLVDRKGSLWIGTHTGGLNRLDRRSGKVKIYRNDSRDPHSLSEDNVRAIFQDRNGTLWIATNHGLNRLDPGSERFVVYLHDVKDPTSLSHNSVSSIYEDRSSRLWVGTRSGLDLLDRARGTFTTFTTRDGLANDAIESIREDRRGNLWLSTHEGISEFQPGTKAVHNFSEEDGLPADFDNPGGPDRSCMTAKQEIVFGSNYGVTVFDPDRVLPNPYVPPVVLTDLRMFNRPAVLGDDSPLRQPIWATRALTLNHAQAIFTLEFSALSFLAPERNKYRYRLEGLETQWNEVDSNRRVATYTSLPAATYVFRVQASNNDLVWNETGVSLAVTVLPPWWGTWWFRTAVALCIAGTVFAAHLFRVSRLESTATLLQFQVAERTRELELAKDAAESAKDAAEGANRAKSAFLSHMSHELRTPLNAILGFAGLLRDDSASEKQRTDLDIIRRSGEHLLGLIDDVLDVAKIEAGKTTVQISCCDLKSLVGDVTAMIRVRTSAKGLALHVIQSPDFPRFVLIDGPKLRQVLINLLGNAATFTDKGSITLRLDARSAADTNDLRLIVGIEDTGVGIAAEDQARIFLPFVRAGHAASHNGTGLGLSIVRNFVETMGGSVRLKSAPGKGSLFQVEAPVQRVDESKAIATQSDQGPIAGLEPGQPEYRILIVEDRRENWELLQRLLQKVGFKVQVAEDGGQGVEIFRLWNPHLICMDLRLPIMGGIEAAREIRALDGGLAVKIVAVTASAFAHQREEVLAAGLDDFVRKPYRPQEIFDCIARHLGVRYLYGEARRNSYSHEPAVMQPAALALLPHSLRRELANALVRLDPGPIEEAIERVAEENAYLGEALASYAKRFAYTEILHALEECNRMSAGGSA